MKRRDFFERVYQVVREIPPGRVASYGQVARWLELANGARSVGWALRALPNGTDVPWQRVVNSRGEISLQGRSRDLQRALLEAEGIEFDRSGRIDLKVWGWEAE